MDGKRFPNGIVAVEKQKANLNGASLTEANLERANFTEANLRGANLFHADLSGQNLDDLKSRGAIIITGQ